ncbi:hypothetical protein RRF57_013244 [Xylaria bambusicola]|uniref:Uncharacterized protein n=1 Tax=Xylaria bambusicola TaxID=326684 RepID=A0AAN7V534_9PEZI
MEEEQKRLEDISGDIAKIESSIMDLKKSGIEVPDVTVRKRFCDLTLKVNQILFQNLDSIRELDPDVKEALFNRELAVYKKNTDVSSTQDYASDSGSQVGVNLTRDPHLSIPQAQGNATAKIQLELAKLRRDLKMSQGSKANMETAVHTLQDKDKESHREISELQRNLRSKDEKLREANLMATQARSLEVRLRSVTELHDQLQTDLARKVVDCDRIQEHLTQRLLQNHRLTLRFNNALYRYQQLGLQHDALKKSGIELKERLDKKSKTFIELDEKLAAEARAYDDLIVKHESLDLLYHDKSTDCDRLKKELDASFNELSRTRQMLEKKRTDLREVGERLLKQENSYVSLLKTFS